MTKETSQSCAEKIAELEPKLRELVERGAPDAEVLAVQNAIQAAKIRIPILLEREQELDRVATKERDLKERAENDELVKGLPFETFHKARLARIRKAFDLLADALQGISEDEQRRDEERKRARERIQRVGTTIEIPSHFYALLPDSFPTVVRRVLGEALTAKQVSDADRRFLPHLSPRGDL